MGKLINIAIVIVFLFCMLFMFGMIKDIDKKTRAIENEVYLLEDHLDIIKINDDETMVDG